MVHQQKPLKSVFGFRGFFCFGEISSKATFKGCRTSFCKKRQQLSLFPGKYSTVEKIFHSQLLSAGFLDIAAEKLQPDEISVQQ